MKPYVVSADLSVLWRRTAGVSLPEDALEQFRLQGAQKLESIFGACDWIAENELEDGLVRLLQANDLPVVSLDQVYTFCGSSLDLTRLVDQNGEEAGYGSRNGDALSLPEKVRNLARNIVGGELVLVDDVMFSGAMYAHLIDLFRENGVRVPRVYAGVAIGEGIRRMKTIDCEVFAVRTYDEVIDEVCERDFMPGAPFSGRAVAGCRNVGMPYLLPFGRPTAWASIPDANARSFSSLFLRLSAEMYRVMRTRRRALPRDIYGLHGDEDVFISDLLTQAAEDI